MKKKSPYNQEAVIRGALRRAFSRSPIVREILEESRQEFPRYKKDGTRHKKNWVKRQCKVCKQWVSSGQIAVDHIDPVISVEYGKKDWNDYIDRLWCNTSGKANLQRICDDCHQKKTNKERFDRQLKKDYELVWSLENEFDCWELDNARKSLTKFTPKKLLVYPQDLQERITKLKHHFGRKNKNSSKPPKGKI